MESKKIRQGKKKKMLWLNELHIECIPFKCYTQNIIFGNTVTVFLKIYRLYRFSCRFASEHNMSCQCKKKNELHITATNHNGAIKTRSVKALELS